MKRLLLAAAFLALQGCASTDKYNEMLDTWIGADINKLVDVWGYPQNTIEAPNGNKVYVYNQSSSYQLPEVKTTTSNHAISGNNISGTSTSYSTGGVAVNQQCTTYFEVDDNNKILKWTWKGNNCKAS